MKIIKNLHMMLFSGGYFSWKKIRCWPVWADDRTGCWRSSRWSRRPAVEMLVCMGPVVERSADEGPHLIRRGSVVEKIDLYEAGGRKGCWRSLRLIWSDLIRGGPAVEKVGRYGTDDKKECWRGPIVLKSAVDFDAYGAIFIHSSHYSPSYSSLVEFIFFNCVLIFLRLRRGPMMINFIWWFRYDLSSAVQKERRRSTTMK